MTTTPAPLVTSCDLQLAHDITASCPLRCLQLSARVHNALCHHLRDPGATVANLVTLCRSGELDDVRSVGPRTAIQIRSVLARCAGLVPPEKEYPHMTVPAEAPARYLLASHPLLRWDAIAAHARDHHQHTWPDDNTARTAITGAFDAITRQCLPVARQVPFRAPTKVDRPRALCSASRLSAVGASGALWRSITLRVPSLIHSQGISPFSRRLPSVRMILL
jgi:hypothetical protein